MTEEKKKPAAKKAAAPKSEAKKPAASKTAPAKKAAAPKKVIAAGSTVTLQQIGSPIGREKSQRATLIGLGLNKIGRQRTLKDSAEVRGMIGKVQHLVKVIG